MNVYKLSSATAQTNLVKPELKLLEEDFSSALCEREHLPQLQVLYLRYEGSGTARLLRLFLLLLLYHLCHDC